MPAESGLYLFVTQGKSKNSTCEIKPSIRQQDGSKVAYIERKEIERLKNSVAFQGFTPLKPHLSVEYWISPKPYHATITYINKKTQEKLIAHIYYKLNGQFFEIQVKKLEEGQTLMQGIQLPVDEVLQMNILTDIASYSRLLQDLIKEKNDYCQKQRRILEHMENDLARLYDNKSMHGAEKKQKIMIQISEILKIIQRLNAYNDTMDPRQRYFENLYSKVRDNMSIEESKEERRPNILVEEKITPKKTQSKSHHKKKTSPQKRKEKLAPYILAINELIDKIQEERANGYAGVNHIIHQQNLFEQLNDYLLTLSFEHSMNQANVAELLEERRNFFLVAFDYNQYKDQLSQLFLEAMNRGNLELVQYLYPYLASKKEMREYFDQFLRQVISCRDERLVKRLISIGDFFYEQSDGYRALIFDFNMKEGYSFEKHAKEYLMVTLFSENQLSVFRMFLRQGILPSMIQFVDNGMEYNAMEALLLCSLYQVEQEINLRFFDALFEHGATMETSMMNKALMMFNENSDLELRFESDNCFLTAIEFARMCFDEVDFEIAVGIYPLPKDMKNFLIYNEDTEQWSLVNFKQRIIFFLNSEKQEKCNAFKQALDQRRGESRTIVLSPAEINEIVDITEQRIPEYPPNIVIAMAERVDLDMKLIGLARLLGHFSVKSELLMHVSGYQFLDSCSEKINQINAVENTENCDVGLLFYPLRKSDLFESIHRLFKMVKQEFLMLELSVQQEKIQSLIRIAIEKGKTDFDAAHGVILLAQLINTLMVKNTADDYKVMIQLLTLRAQYAKADEKSTLFLTAWQLCRQVNVLYPSVKGIKTTSFSIINNIKKIPEYQHLDPELENQFNDFIAMNAHSLTNPANSSMSFVSSMSGHTSVLSTNIIGTENTDSQCGLNQHKYGLG